MRQSFEVRLRDDGSFELPIDVRALYGEARPPVKMTVRGQTFRTRVMVYGGKSYLGLWKSLLAEERLRGGDRLETKAAAKSKTQREAGAKTKAQTKRKAKAKTKAQTKRRAKAKTKAATRGRRSSRPARVRKPRAR